MKGRPKKCCNCGKVVCLIVPNGNVGGISTARAQEVEPFLIRGGKYWCKECFDKRSKEA